MLGGLFARHRGSSSHAAPPPPKLVEPPLLPSLEKRQEKERKWMESISNKGKRTAQSSHPPLPVPVEYIRKDQQPGPSTTPTSTGLLDRWTTSPHKRGSTAGSHALHAPSHTTADENRSLRTTRSTSALASRLGGTLKSTIASSGRKSKERDRHRQQSGTSSLLIDHAAAPRTHPTLLRTPPLLQLGGGEDPSFVHVPQLSPSSTLLVPSLPHPRTQHSLDRNIPSAPLTSSLTTPDASQPTPHPRASHIDTAKSLATRLQELEHANNVGLLNDEEYRVLRQNLFQKSVGERKLGNMPTPMPSSLAEGGLSLTPLSVPSGPPGNGVQRTGTLLGLPRLNMAEGDTRGEHDP